MRVEKGGKIDKPISKINGVCRKTREFRHALQQETSVLSRLDRSAHFYKINLTFVTNDITMKHLNTLLTLAAAAVITLSSCEGILSNNPYGTTKCTVEAYANEAIVSFEADIPENVTGFRVGAAISEEDPILHYDAGETFSTLTVGLPGKNRYTIVVYGLQPNTTYKIRAFVSTNVELAYWGDPISFTTPDGESEGPGQDPDQPVVTPPTPIVGDIDYTMEGFEAIDMGGTVLWANMNIGAKVPGEIGYFYAWGEVEPLTEMNYMKYNPDNGYKVDKNGNLKPEYDIATVVLGDGWRTPTMQEIQEILELPYTDNGKSWVIKAKNGKTLELPLGGHYELFWWQEHTYYWTSTMIEPNWAYTINMWHEVGYDIADQGRLVRAVKSK